MPHDIPLVERESLYDSDYVLWAEQQAKALRARDAGANALDYDNLADEVDDLGKSVERACRSQLDNIITHCLKLQFVAAPEAQRHWRAEIRGFRDQLEDEMTPTLRRRLEPELGKLVRRAVKRLLETGELDDGEGVDVILQSYTWERLTDENWFPEPAVDAQSPSAAALRTMIHGRARSSAASLAPETAECRGDTVHTPPSPR